MFWLLLQGVVCVLKYKIILKVKRQYHFFISQLGIYRLPLFPFTWWYLQTSLLFQVMFNEIWTHGRWQHKTDSLCIAPSTILAADFCSHFNCCMETDESFGAIFLLSKWIENLEVFYHGLIKTCVSIPDFRKYKLLIHNNIKQFVWGFYFKFLLSNFL